MTAVATKLERVSPSRREQRHIVGPVEDRIRELTKQMLRDLQQIMDAETWRMAMQAGDIPGAFAIAVRERAEKFAKEVAPILARESALVEQIDFDAFARFNIGEFIKVFELGQLAAAREILRGLFEFGPTKENLESLGKAVGLTDRQVKAVKRARRAAADAGAPPEVSAKVASSVRDRLLDYRARMIARTEAVRHAAEIIQARGEELVRQGKIVTRQWLSARDDNVDNGNPNGPCAVNDNGERISMFELFPSGHNLPPAHPFCRCVIELWVET